MTGSEVLADPDWLLQVLRRGGRDRALMLGNVRGDDVDSVAGGEDDAEGVSRLLDGREAETEELPYDVRLPSDEAVESSLAILSGWPCCIAADAIVGDLLADDAVEDAGDGDRLCSSCCCCCCCCGGGGGGDCSEATFVFAVIIVGDAPPTWVE